MTGISTDCVPLRHLQAAPKPVHFEADAARRKALAERFALQSVDSLVADVELRRQGQVVSLDGQFSAAVVQTCVVSGEPVAAQVGGPLRLRFAPETDAGEDIELDSDLIDTLPLAGDAVDVAEAIAQSLYLALDPYPRAPDAVLAKYRRYLGEAPAPEPPTKRPFAGLRVIDASGKTGDA